MLVASLLASAVSTADIAVAWTITSMVQPNSTAEVTALLAKRRAISVSFDNLEYKTCAWTQHT